MGSMARAGRLLRMFLPTIVLAALFVPVVQAESDRFLTGQAAYAWENWVAALEQVQTQNFEDAEDLFDALLNPDAPKTPVTPMRLALLEDRATKRAAGAGAILILETEAKRGNLEGNAQKIVDMLKVGREQLAEARDGWYFSSIGRFDIAQANFKALLDQDPDPVALLEYADSVPSRQQVLVQLVGNPIVGESVKKIQELLGEGEHLIKSDPVRIRRNIDRLAGTPRAFENAVALLKDSGEYAIPLLIETLRAESNPELIRPVLLTLPQIDRPALNPLLASLVMPDTTVKEHAIQALAKIGYPQAVPYLLDLASNSKTEPRIQAISLEAIKTIAMKNREIDTTASPADAFFTLAEQYYNGRPELMPDPRLATANVWYWRDDILQNVKVPTGIFDEVMAMRLCQKAMAVDADHKAAQSLWLAANFRREAQLGDEVDKTRPENFPTGAYFAQSAGAERCQMALARAVKANEPAVALGTIDALRKTAGPVSLFGGETAQPLADALAFPDRMVRIQAALALGYAAPEKPFYGYQNLMPVLSQTLMLHNGRQNALVVDADDETANKVAGVLRGEGFNVVTDGNLLAGLTKVRSEAPGLDVIFLAADTQSPDLTGALAKLRGEFRFASVPVVLIAKSGYEVRVRDLSIADYRIAMVSSAPSAGEVTSAVSTVSEAVGIRAIDEEMGLSLAKQATEILHTLAISKNPTFSPADVEPALLAAFGNEDTDLKIAIAKLFAYLPSSEAQQAIAALAISEDTDKELRITMFDLLAQAAKKQGNLLGSDLTETILKMAETYEDMDIRTSASQVLGALNVPGNPASQIIRNVYRG